MQGNGPYPKPSVAPEAEEEPGVVWGGLTLEIFTRILTEGAMAMEQAVKGDEVVFREDYARVSFVIRPGEDVDAFFEKAKQEYHRKKAEMLDKWRG